MTKLPGPPLDPEKTDAYCEALADFINAWNAHATRQGLESDYILDHMLKEVLAQDSFDISPFDSHGDHHDDAFGTAIERLQHRLYQVCGVCVTQEHISTCFLKHIDPAPAVVIALLAKTTGRYAALEWLCHLAGCRLVVPTTPDKEGADA